MSMLSPDLLDTWGTGIAGQVLRPSEPGFDDTTRIWNGLVQRRPRVVVRPRGTADIVATVDLARRTGLPISIRGGGHNIAGTALVDDGITLDMSLLREVTVDPVARLAHVDAGCLLHEVDQATQAHGLAIQLGFISQVGVAGLTLGGGLGYLTRRFGWTVDDLDEVEVVLADGRVTRARHDHEPDLFWALRGGGGNFGVVTRFSYRLHEVGPLVFGGLIAWPLDRLDDVVETYRSMTSSAPRELAVWLMLVRAPQAPFVPSELQGQRVCAMSVCWSGRPEEATGAIAPLRDLGTPGFDLLGEVPYVALQSSLDATEPKGRHYYWKTELLSRLDDDLLGAIADLHRSCPVPDGWVGLLHLEGALNERPEEDAAIGNRDARYALGIAAAWDPGDPAADDHRAWVRAAWERLRPYSLDAAYINFQMADEGPDRIRAAYGANYDRLLEIKRRYDPDNLFRVNRNITDPVTTAGRGV